MLKAYFKSVLRRLHLLTYLLIPMCRVLLEQLTGLQLIKKFPAFHETRKFITALTRVRHLSLILGQPNPVHIPTSHLLEIQPNIFHPSTSRSPQWPLSLRFPQQETASLNNTRIHVHVTCCTISIPAV